MPAPTDAFDYAATEGDPALREALVEELAGTSDETTLARLTITSGGMQGLDLACKLFVDPGDLVVVESPTYTNGSATALSYQADLLEVPVDGDGMHVDRWRTSSPRPAAPPRPSTRSPRSRTRPAPPCRSSAAPAARARAVVGRMVIDDDPYGMLRFEGEPVPTLHELAAATRWSSPSAPSRRSWHPACASVGSTRHRSCSRC